MLIEKTITNSRNVNNEIDKSFNKQIFTTNISQQAVHTNDNFGSNILQTQNNVSVNLKKKQEFSKKDNQM